MNERRVTEIERELEKLKEALAEERQRGDRLEASLAAMLLLETHGGRPYDGSEGAKVAHLVDLGMNALSQSAPGFDKSQGSIGHAVITAMASMIHENNRVEAQDPDRFAFQLKEVFNRHTHPTGGGPSGVPSNKLKAK